MALQNCTLLYAIILAVGGTFLLLLDPLLDQQEQEDTTTTFYHHLSQGLLFFLFITENSFIQLLFTQQWAFMSSVQSREEAAIWFAPIAGLGSIASTASAFTVSPLVNKVSLAGLLLVASTFMFGSAYCGMNAYQIAKEVCVELVHYICIFMCVCLWPNLSFLVCFNLVLSQMGNSMALHPNRKMMENGNTTIHMMVKILYSERMHYLLEYQYWEHFV